MSEIGLAQAMVQANVNQDLINSSIADMGRPSATPPATTLDGITAMVQGGGPASAPSTDIEFQKNMLSAAHSGKGAIIDAMA